MSMLYYRANNIAKEKLVKADTKNGGCGFCDPAQIKIIGETELFWIIQNRMPYDLFDGVPVEGHLMIAPKAHRTGIAELTAAEKLEYVDLLAKYEAINYSVYSRGIGNVTRTAGHLHTHLLLLQRKRVSALLYLSKPYMVVHPGRFRKAEPAKIQG